MTQRPGHDSRQAPHASRVTHVAPAAPAPGRPTARMQRSAGNAAVYRVRRARTRRVQRWEGWEHVAVGDDLAPTTQDQRYVGEGGHLPGGATGYLVLDAHRVDLPEFARGDP